MNIIRNKYRSNCCFYLNCKSFFLLIIVSPLLRFFRFPRFLPQPPRIFPSITIISSGPMTLVTNINSQSFLFQDPFPEEKNYSKFLPQDFSPSGYIQDSINYSSLVWNLPGHCVCVCVCDERYFSLGAIFYVCHGARHISNERTNSGNRRLSSPTVFSWMCEC